MIPSFNDYAKSVTDAIREIDTEKVSKLKSAIGKRLDGKSSIFVIGNGGSAANAHHITGDYTKTFALKRQKIRIECLSDNNCYLTAASNDLDFSEVYEILIGTRIAPGDLVIMLSGSGNSMNLVKAARAALISDVVVASITAYSGGALKELSHIPIHTPVCDMEIAEDLQMIIMHYIKQALCEEILLSSEEAANELIMTKYTKRISEGLVS